MLRRADRGAASTPPWDTARRWPAWSAAAVALALAWGVGPGRAAAADFFFDTFETSAISTTLWSQTPSTVPNPDSSVVLDNSNYPGAPAGQRSAQQLYHAGTTDGGGVGWMNIGKAALPTHVLVEFDFKLSSNFHFPLGHKWWRSMPDMNSGAGPNDVTVNLQLNCYGTCWSLEIFSNSSQFGYRETVLRPPTQVSRNTWHRVGVRLKRNTFSGTTPNSDGEIEVFLDGASAGRQTGVRLAADPTRWLRDYWGGPGNYTSVTDNNPIPEDQWIRVDNFRITDLAGGSSPPATVTLPAAPSGLVVQ